MVEVFIFRAAVKLPRMVGLDLGGTIVAVAKGSTDVTVDNNIVGRVEPTEAYESPSQ